MCVCHREREREREREGKDQIDKHKEGGRKRGLEEGKEIEIGRKRSGVERKR